MSIWFDDCSLEQLNESSEKCMVSHCGIEITEINEDSLVGTMPVDERTVQPFGILHGGANCVLAETLGSIAANLTCDSAKQHGVGVTITTNHIKPARNGKITGVAKPIHLGRTSHVWEIKTYNDAKSLTSTTNLTIAIMNKLGSKS